MRFDFNRDMSLNSHLAKAEYNTRTCAICLFYPHWKFSTRNRSGALKDNKWRIMLLLVFAWVWCGPRLYMAPRRSHLQNVKKELSHTIRPGSRGCLFTLHITLWWHVKHCAVTQQTQNWSRNGLRYYHIDVGRI